MSETRPDTEAIAIIGMDGRFPGAPDVASYWRNLLEGRETLHRFGAGELDAAVPAELRGHADYVPVRGVLEHAECFDAAFFGISPREAEMMDPQQRVFLELCWRALEDAGYAPGTHEAMTGVFAGMSYNTYFNAHVARHPQLLAAYGEIPALVANEKDYLATRVAYKFDLRGPCINVSTACSTSLVAVCHAVNSLLDYQCDLALAGGVSILCPQQRGYLWQDGSIYARDGRCRPFDASAAGTVFGNGGGVVVVKRLSEALADRDTIHAVIRGAAMNNDGAGKVSFTAPSVDGQAEVVQLAQEFAGVHPDDIGYIEAHGTGTALGDPIEISALTQAFRLRTRRRGYCGIGSVKGNIGHLDAASGIAGLVKATLALREERIPPTLHFEQANPELHLDETPFRVVDRARDWPRGNAPRFAAVSSFGLGGTNAHLVLEEAPPPPAAAPGMPQQLLVLSAKTPAALERARHALAEKLEAGTAELADVAWTLQRGRKTLPYRLALAASDRRGAASALRTGNAPLRRGEAGPPAPVVFMFPGQGSQYPGMCAELYRDEPLVRDIIDRCADALGDALEFDLRDVMFGRNDNAAELLDETCYTQPALFAAACALAKLWQQWGVQPRALVGHSIGEFAAAALAGVFSLEDAARLVAERGRLMQERPAGSMLSVRLPEAELAGRLPDSLAVAATNAPGFCVVSGAERAIARFRAQLESEGTGCTLLRTSHAFHSPMMEGAVAPFEQYLRGVELETPRLPIFSTATGRRLADDEALDPAYWARQLRVPVRFMQALESARDALGGRGSWIECGPGAAASTFAVQTFGDAGVPVVTSLGRRGETRDERTLMLDAAGRLWTHGQDIDWTALHGGLARRRVPLPAYAFERTRHWLDSVPQATPVAGDVPAPQPAATAPPAAAAAGDESPLPEQLAQLLQEVAGIHAAGAQYDTGFAELGLDSLFLAQFSQALKKRFHVDLKNRELLVEHNTLHALARLIERRRETRAAAESPAPAAAPGAPAATPSLNARQQASIDELLRRYGWRTSASRAYARTHRSHLADVAEQEGDELSTAPLAQIAYPLIVRSASGARLQDIDGNGYVDLAGAHGANLLGHNAPVVVDAIRQQLKRNYATAMHTPLAGRVARLVQALTGFERVAFTANEPDALRQAVRAARAATQREAVALLSADVDSLAALRGDAGVEIVGYGAPDAAQRLAARMHELAAVVVEPVPVEARQRFMPELMRELRRLTEAGGAALIFDETVSGLRVHPAGAQGLLGLRADLAVYGGCCGGGLPLGVLAGAARFVQALDAAGSGRARPATPLALAAAEATLTQLQEGGAALQRALDERTARLVAELERHCRETRAPVRIRHFASWFLLDIDERVPCADQLHARLRAGGVHAWEGAPCFLSLAHNDIDLAQVGRVFREALDAMAEAGFFDGIARPAPAARTAPAATADRPPVPNARLGRRPDGRPGWFIPDPERPGRYREVRAN